MNTILRNTIVREAIIRISKAYPNYSSLMYGEKELIQDKYIDDICKELGHTKTQFYAEDGKKLDKILSKFDDVNHMSRYILKDNLIIALKMAIHKQAEDESKLGYHTDSALLGGWRDCLNYLETHGTLTIQQ